MQRAIELARRAVGLVSPNPPVGAVLVKDGRVVGEGSTMPPGQAHAEIVALRQAGADAVGADLYVTLEPCSHHGRTPPCTTAIIEAGVRSVRVAALDPNPEVNGKGISLLEKAGIGVTLHERDAAVQELIEPFAKYVTTGMPFVVAKFAVSLDGKIATRTGDSRWISNEASRRLTHTLRAEADAVMAGIGTVIADDPRLTMRDVDSHDRQPTRVVVDSTGRLSPSAAMLSEPGETIVAVANAPAERAAALREAGVEVLTVGADDGRVALRALLLELGGRQITSILVEGGSGLLGSLFDAGLVDKVVAMIAPMIIGGASAPGPVGSTGAASIREALRLTRVTFEEAEGDMVVVGYPEPSGNA